LVRTPGLAERVADIPLIVRHLLEQVSREDPELRARFCQTDGEVRLSANVITRFVRGRAVGNVRSLRNTLWRSLAESPGDTLVWPVSVNRESPADSSNGAVESDSERERIRAALDRNQGSMDKTWRELGLSSRFALNRLLKKHGIALRRSSS
jgi:two-component system nitrogen regulation response regulator GlnG/two-component system response regulator HydG